MFVFAEKSYRHLDASGRNDARGGKGRRGHDVVKRREVEASAFFQKHGKILGVTVSGFQHPKEDLRFEECLLVEIRLGRHSQQIHD